MTSVRFVATLVFVSIPLGSVTVQGAGPDEFPNRPLRYIVPFPPGGSTDIVARIVADGLTSALQEQVVIDNRGGAAGTIGADIAARSTPDGYTLFACNIASLAVSPAIYKKLPYDPVKDFTPIGLIGSNPNTLATNSSVPAKSVAEFIAFAKGREGKLNYASPGVGTSPQLSMEMFKMRAGIDLVHVAYKGGGPAVVALMGAEVHAMFGTVPSLLGAIHAQKVRSLAVTSKTRSPDLPDVPTLHESGMPGFEIISWQGLCTPRGVPARRLARLRTATEKALAMPETRKRLAHQGIQLTPLTDKKFAEFIRSEAAKYAKLIKDVGIPRL
jgi:tripartite-type tricarboxylate transporter receptor subunit TctC